MTARFCTPQFRMEMITTEDRNATRSKIYSGRLCRSWAGNYARVLAQPHWLKGTRARVFFGSFSQVWALLQSFYTKRQNDSSEQIIYRRALYRNSSLCVLGQIEAVPNCRLKMFFSLLTTPSELEASMTSNRSFLHC